MLDRARLVAFSATSNGPRARRFYERVLGLRVLSDDAFALVLDANGTLLRVQKVETLVPPPFTTLGWEVPDIALLVERLSRGGVVFEKYPGMAQDQRGVWLSPSGARVVWFKDPDGNTLSLTQR